MGSIYGNLTVEFFPNVPDIAFADYQGIVETNINLRGAPVVVGTVNINVSLENAGTVDGRSGGCRSVH